MSRSWHGYWQCWAGLGLFRLCSECVVLNSKAKNIVVWSLLGQLYLPFIRPCASMNLWWLGALMALVIVFLVLRFLWQVTFFVVICPWFYRLSQNHILVWSINFMVALDIRRKTLDLVIITNYILVILAEGISLQIWILSYFPLSNCSNTANVYGYLCLD